MFPNPNLPLTRAQLYDCLDEYLILDDRIDIEVDVYHNSEQNDGQALIEIGYQYDLQGKHYDKAMAWYQIGANQNDSDAYSKIGELYEHGHGVPQDYIIAIEYYLKAARNNHKNAMSNMGRLYLNGQGVPADQHKALEWYSKSKVEHEKVEELKHRGFHLRKEDKKKNIHQLANEVEHYIRNLRMTRESELTKEIQGLNEMKIAYKLEQDELIKSSREFTVEIQQKLKENENAIILLQSLVQAKASEIALLQEYICNKNAK